MAESSAASANYSHIPPRKSDRYAKSGEQMLDVLANDIMRYEMLSEQEELNVLASVLGGESSDLVELQEIVLEQNDEGIPPITEQDKENSLRYKDITSEDTDKFIADNMNKNTIYKTKSDLKTFVDWARASGELREVEHIPHTELDNLLARFYLGVRNKEGNEYEPDTLTGFQNSIDRHLKNKKVQVDLKKDDIFSHSRKVLESKRKELKKQGKGNKRNRAESLDSDEMKALYGKQLLGAANPTSLLNTVWLNLGVFLGFRGRQEHCSLLLGDLQLKTDSSGKEFVEFNERTTKTRSGAKSTDYRDVSPKMFAQPGNPNCPVKMLKLYLSKRPLDLRDDDKSRFYLRPLAKPKEDEWYGHQPLGKNKIGNMMKTMASVGEISGRKVNHSSRKTFATTLLHNDTPITEVAQLGGWKGVSTLTHYNVPSVKQQNKASNILSDVMIPQAIEPDGNSDNGDKDTCNMEEDQEIVLMDNEKDQASTFIPFEANPKDVYFTSQSSVINKNQSLSNMIASRKDSSNPFNILGGASIHGGVINLNIYSGKSFSSSQE